MVSEHFVRRCSVERSYMKRKKRHHNGTNSREGDNSLLNSVPCQQSKKKPKVQMLSIGENWLRMLTTDGLPSPLYWLSELISLKCHDSDHEDIYNKITVNSYISARLSGRPITIMDSISHTTIWQEDGLFRTMILDFNVLLWGSALWQKEPINFAGEFMTL